MNRTLRKCCAALLAILAVYAAPAAEKTVYLKDFLAPGAAGTDAVPAVRAALEHCAEVGASRLVLPGGQLRMRPDRAVEKYQFISNNDESLKRIAFDLVGMRDFEIDGNGTELLFTGFISPFSLEDCENITVRDLTIDFTRTFNSEGTVVAKGDGWLEIEFPEDYLCDIVNGCLRFRDAEGTVYPFSNLLEFDAVRREPAFRATDYWLSNRTIPAEKCANGNIRILRKDLTATVGNVMVFGAAARYNPGFTLADCRGVAIRDVNLYHCGGMGVIAQRSRDIELRKLVIVPSPGKGRMISITADATHYVNCGGYIRMIDCTFENQKDDATNIHGLYMAVEKVGARQTAAPLAQLGAVRRGFHRAGDAPRTGRQQQRGDLCPPDGEVRQAPQQGLHRSHLHRAAPRRGRAHACRGGRRRISRGAHQGLPHARQPGARTAAGLAQPHGHRG